jgi:short-subunit dehydrogenase
MGPFQSVLITGASSGIGRALAVACAGPGVVLHLGGRSAERLAETAAACRAGGAETRPRAIDVTDAAGMAGWIARAGRLDLVVANAGISGGTGREQAETAAQTRAIFAVNVDGMLNTVLPAIDAMRAQAPGDGGVRGRIAVIASIAGFMASPGAPAYCAGKAAADGWAVATAANLAREGIVLTSVCPGFIRTPMTSGNPYPMPGLMDAGRAARIILRGVAAGRRRVVFPWWMGVLARIAGLMPPRIVAAFTSTTPGKAPIQ